MKNELTNFWPIFPAYIPRKTSIVKIRNYLFLLQTGGHNHRER